MTVRARILTIRLMEKVNANRAYAEILGIVVVNGLAGTNRQTDSSSAGNKP